MFLSQRKLISITLYSSLTLSIYSFAFSSEVMNSLYSAWVGLYFSTPWLLQKLLIIIGGAISVILLKNTGSYSVEFDLKNLIKKQQKGLSVVRGSVLATIILWFLIFQYSNLNLSIFLSSLHIFLLIYIGKIIANAGYIYFYTMYIKKFIYKNELNRIPSANTLNKAFIESPITLAIEDKYERDLVAYKLKDKLTGASDARFRRIALVGSFGSGKSSTLNLIENLILDEQVEQSSSDGGWVFVRFDAWGKADNTNNIQGLLLTEIINTLSKTIETSSIKSLPEKYLLAMKDVHSSSKIISHFINSSAEEQLAKLNRLLKESNYRVCVFIEDIDRNINAENATNSIAPLLNNLKYTEQVSFIFTLGYSSGASSIVSRITDYREDLPVVDFKCELIKLVEEQLEIGCRKKVEFFYEKDNSKWEILKKSNLFGYSDYEYRVIPKLSVLISSAREFAAIKREVSSRWPILAGELNFKDLIILTTLKISCPLVFDFINLNIRLLQEGTTETLNKNWANLKFGDATYTQQFSKKMVQNLFPLWNDSSGNSSVGWSQSVANYSFKNYWNTYLSLSTKSTHTPNDQVIFNEMIAFSDDACSSAVPRFINMIIKNNDSIDFIASMARSRMELLGEVFFNKVLKKLQSELTLIKDITTGDIDNLNESWDQSKTLKRAFEVFSSGSKVIRKEHLTWAIKHSFAYCSMLNENNALKLSELYIEVFVELVSDNKSFSKLIENQDNNMKLLLSFLDLKLIKPVNYDGYTCSGDGSKSNKNLHVLLFKIASEMTEKDDIEKIYKKCLLKYTRVNQEGSYSCYKESFYDCGAISLLNDNNRNQLTDMFNDADWIKRGKEELFNLISLDDKLT